MGSNQPSLFLWPFLTFSNSYVYVITILSLCPPLTFSLSSSYFLLGHHFQVCLSTPQFCGNSFVATILIPHFFLIMVLFSQLSVTLSLPNGIILTTPSYSFFLMVLFSHPFPCSSLPFLPCMTIISVGSCVHEEDYFLLDNLHFTVSVYHWWSIGPLVWSIGRVTSGPEAFPLTLCFVLHNFHSSYVRLFLFFWWILIPHFICFSLVNSFVSFLFCTLSIIRFVCHPWVKTLHADTIPHPLFPPSSLSHPI